MNHKVKLKDIAIISSGSNAPKKEYFSKSGLPFIRAGHLESLIDGLDIRNLPKVNDVTSKNLKLKKAPKGSVLFAKSGMSCKKNRVYKTNDESFIVNHLACITPESENITNDYLKYFIEWYKPSRLIRDESYPSIRLSDISNIELELPSLSTQSKITKTLNLAVKIIQIRQQQIEALSALKQSVFLEMFGDPITNNMDWNLKSLGELGDWKSGGTPRRKNKEYYQGSIPWLSSGELNNIYVYDSKEHITEQAIEESSAKLIEKNSLLLGMYDTAGLKSSINKINCSCNQAIAFTKLNEEVASLEFVYQTIQIMRKYLLNQQRGVRQKNFNLTMIKGIKIILPPIELQKCFSNNLKEIIHFEDKLNSSLFYYDSLYNSILHKAFNGELFKEDIKV